MTDSARAIRRKVLEMCYKAQTGHIGSCLSCVDILDALYMEYLTHDDIFIMSKGHAAAALYATLHQVGILSQEDLDGFCTDGSPLIGHVSHEVPGVHVSTGSLGHGLPIGVGYAMAKKLENKPGNVFVLMSDGEMDCGTTWESALLASHHELNNLFVIIDKNGWQACGKTEDVLRVDRLRDKFSSFGWYTYPWMSIHAALNHLLWVSSKTNKPIMIASKTTKGSGVSFMEDKLEWHYQRLTQEQYELALRELE